MAASALLVALCCGLAVHLALRAPVLGLRLVEEPSGGVRVVDVAPDSPNRDRLAPGQVLRRAMGPSGDIPLDGDLLEDEPDQLGTWERFNSFMARQTALAGLLAGGTLTVELADGGRATLASRPRRLTELPALFWFQVAVGSAGFLLASGVLAFRASDWAARHFALSGLGFLFFSSAAAVYSTREFILDGRLFLALSAVNQCFAVLFTAALAALLGCYPRKVRGWGPLSLGLYALMVVGCLSFLLQWVPDLSGVPGFVLGLFSTTFALAFVQWWGTRGRPDERAALKWFLLSIYLGTCLFAGFVLLPGALGMEPPASQGLMFAVFLFMFAGIALGITRYRLFELDRWWFQAWSWFLGGLAVILVDFALAASLRLSQVGALGLSLALVGWVYFPLRQAVWARWQRKAINDRQDRFGQWMLALFSTTREDALRAQWHAVLRGEFAPLELLEAPGAAQRVQVSQDGLTLTVPALRPGHVVTLRHPAQGARLFRREDIAAAEVLVGMGRRALEAQREREQGALAERGRIMRDLHDDLGAKLLSLVYLTSGGEGESLARSAMRDMRDVLEALEATPCVLAEAVAEWRAEAQGRADAVGFRLEWEADGLPEQLMVSARQRTNISRILREAITNAIKHARAKVVSVRIAFHAQQGLALLVEDDGGTGAVAPEQWGSGLGTRVIRQRAADLGGSVQWRQGTRGCRLELAVPLEPGASG
jgi:signal transduction histidine kinase